MEREPNNKKQTTRESKKVETGINETGKRKKNKRNEKRQSKKQ